MWCLHFDPVCICKAAVRKKGKPIKYEKLQIADYLVAESIATLEDKVDVFALLTEMNDLPHIFGRSAPCKFGCQDDIFNFHILICQDL